MKKLFYLSLLLLASKVNAAFPIVPVIISTGTLQQGATIYVSSITATNITSTGTVVFSTLTVTSSFTVSGFTTHTSSVTISTNAVVTGQFTYGTSISSYAVIPSSLTSNQTSFLGCISTITITSPISYVPKFSAYFSVGNFNCAGGGNSFEWVLEDGAFVNGENSTTGRYQQKVIGSNEEPVTVTDILPSVSAGTHNFCFGGDGNIGGGCGGMYINQSNTGSNWIISEW